MLRKHILSIVKNSPLKGLFYFLKKQQLRKNHLRFLEDNVRMLEFYRTMINPGDLVFDIGANFGNRSKVFAEIGARVTAFEPQKSCADYLKAYFYREKNVQVESVALGEHPSTATMTISKNSVLSTLSNDYIERSVNSGRFPRDEWQGSQIVKIETLDNYIGKFGTPSFVKIDVEGFEYEVLKGLSSPISLISFEFASENSETVLRCVEKLQSLADYNYQFSPDESFVLKREDWCSYREIVSQIQSFKGLEWGDIYCSLK
jgi:FkbM family methyltransferase